MFYPGRCSGGETAHFWRNRLDRTDPAGRADLPHRVARLRLPQTAQLLYRRRQGRCGDEEVLAHQDATVRPPVLLLLDQVLQLLPVYALLVAERRTLQSIKTRWRHNADFRSKACTHKNCPKLNVSHQIRPSSFLVRSGKNVFYAMFSACTWTPSLYFCSSCIGMRTWFVHRDTSHWLWGQIMRLVTYKGVCWPTVRKSWEMTVNPDVNTKTRNNRKTQKQPPAVNQKNAK